MGKDIDTQALIARVYHHNSTQGRNLAQLAEEYTSNNNTMGIALINQVLTTVADKMPNGKKFSGHIVPKYLSHEKVDVGQRIGKATISGQALREGHAYSITLYDRNGEVQGKAGQLKRIGNTKAVPDFLVGNEHKITLERILAAGFEPSQLKKFQEERDAAYERASSLANEFDTVFERFGVPKEAMGSYRRMMLLGPIQLGDDDSILTTLSDPNALRGDLSWLAASVDGLPETVQQAYHRFTSTVTTPSPHDAATLVAAIYQFKSEKAEGIIGSFRDDVHYLQKLDDDHEVVKAVGKPKLDKELETVSFFGKNGKHAAAKGQTLEETLEKQFITRADALALMRQIPVYEAREVHNRALAARYCGNDLPTMLDAACASAAIEAKRYHDAKRHEEEFVPEMLKDEYKDARYAATLAGYAKSRLTESSRDSLIRLLPMARAHRIFGSIARVGRKKQAGVPFDRSMTLIEDTSFEKQTLEKLAWLPLIGKQNASTGNKYLAGRAGMTLDKIGAAQQALRVNETAINYGLVPESIALLDVKIPDANRNAFVEAVEGAKPIGTEASLLQRLQELKQEPITLSINNRHASSGSVTHTKSHPRFSLDAYEGSRYLTDEQRAALKRIASDVKLYIGDAKPSELAQHWQNALTAAGSGAKFYTGDLSLDATVRIEQHDPTQQKLESRLGLTYRNPRDIKDYADAILTGKLDEQRRDQLVKVKRAQRRRAPGYTPLLEDALEGRTYLLPSAIEAIDGAHKLIINNSYPVNRADAVEDGSLQLFNTHGGRFSVDIRSEGRKPWLEVLDTFSKKRGGQGTPQDFKWHFGQKFAECRLYAENLPRYNVERLVERLAQHNKDNGTNLYVTLSAAR